MRVSPKEAPITLSQTTATAHRIRGAAKVGTTLAGGVAAGAMVACAVELFRTRPGIHAPEAGRMQPAFAPADEAQIAPTGQCVAQETIEARDDAQGLISPEVDSPRASDHGAGGRTVRRVGAALTLLATLAMLVAAAAITRFHIGFQPVLSGSMRPTFSPGSLVLTRAVPTKTVHPGDVILFTPPGERTPFVHRVASVSGPLDRPIITTKGDANPVEDPWKAQLLTAAVPQVIASIPEVGRVIIGIQNLGLRLILMALGGLSLCIVGTRIILGQKPEPATTETPGEP